MKTLVMVVTLILVVGAVCQAAEYGKVEAFEAPTASVFPNLPPVTPGVERYFLMPLTLVELDGDSIHFDGPSGWYDREVLAGILREQTAKSSVRFVVSGERFEQIAASQDRVHESGRYRDVAVVPRGQMPPPVARFFVTIKTEYRETDYGLGNWLKNVDLSSGSGWAEVILTETGIASGVDRREYKGETTKSSLTEFDYRSFGEGAEYEARNPRDTFVQSAFRDAMAKAARKMVREYQKPPICPIDVYTGRVISWGDEIVFKRSGQEIARYVVVFPLSGNMIGVYATSEIFKPGPGDDFDIVTPTN